MREDSESSGDVAVECQEAGCREHEFVRESATVHSEVTTTSMNERLAPAPPLPLPPSLEEREQKEVSEDTNKNCTKIIGEIGKEGDSSLRLDKLCGLLDLIRSAPGDDQPSLIQLLHNNWMLIDPCTDTGPFDLIVPGVYCGGVSGTRDENLLKFYSIDCILTIATRIEPLFPSEFEYKVITLKDDLYSCIGEFLSETYHWIRSRVEKKKNVLVHCKAGVSRSATIVIAYIMRLNHWSTNKALEFARSRRSVINPNANFLKQLRIYEHHNYLQDGNRLDWYSELEREQSRQEKAFQERRDHLEEGC